jgi:hypothetical protein
VNKEYTVSKPCGCPCKDIIDTNRIQTTSKQTNKNARPGEEGTGREKGEYKLKTKVGGGEVAYKCRVRAYLREKQRLVLNIPAVGVLYKE